MASCFALSALFDFEEEEDLKEDADVNLNDGGQDPGHDPDVRITGTSSIWKKINLFTIFIGHKVIKDQIYCSRYLDFMPVKFVHNGKISKQSWLYWEI